MKRFHVFNAIDIVICFVFFFSLWSRFYGMGFFPGHPSHWCLYRLPCFDSENIHWTMYTVFFLYFSLASDTFLCFFIWDEVAILTECVINFDFCSVRFFFLLYCPFWMLWIWGLFDSASKREEIGEKKEKQIEMKRRNQLYRFTKVRRMWQVRHISNCMFIFTKW